MDFWNVIGFLMLFIPGLALCGLVAKMLYLEWKDGNPIPGLVVMATLWALAALLLLHS